MEQPHIQGKSKDEAGDDPRESIREPGVVAQREDAVPIERTLYVLAVDAEDGNRAAIVLFEVLFDCFKRGFVSSF